MRTVTLAIATGDPQGIGPAISIAAARHAVEDGVRVVLVGDATLLEGLGAPISRYPSTQALSVLDVSSAVLDQPPPSAAGGAAAMAALGAACDLVDSGVAHALVTAPLSKEAVARDFPGFVGHTGWLGRRYGVDPVMMLANDALRIVLVTDHVPIRDVSAAIDRALLEHVLAAALRATRDLYGAAVPRIAVLGLNPHAGEGGQLGREEIEIITPAIEACGGVRAGIEGPFPADSFFRPGRSSEFDAVVAMYHDQGLIALKSSSAGQGVNITLGLPIIRTSPDHGTAFDLPRGTAPDHRSMIRAIEEAVRLASR